MYKIVRYSSGLQWFFFHPITIISDFALYVNKLLNCLNSEEKTDFFSLYSLSHFPLVTQEMFLILLYQLFSSNFLWDHSLSDQLPLSFSFFQVPHLPDSFPSFELIFNFLTMTSIILHMYCLTEFLNRALNLFHLTYSDSLSELWLDD